MNEQNSFDQASARNIRLWEFSLARRLASDGLFYGLVVLALCWLLLSVFKSGWFFRATPLIHEAAPLDSFSPPSLALSVLNREALRLEMGYSQARDAAGHSAGPPSLAGVPQAELPPAPELARCAQAAAPLAKLDAQVEALKVQLDCRLMWIYSENGFDHEFLNRFLCLVTEAPNSSDFLLWLPRAAVCARSCGRSEELADALRHLVQFDNNPQRVRVVRELLERTGLSALAGDESLPR
jgi:hypothetical protein